MSTVDSSRDKAKAPYPATNTPLNELTLLASTIPAMFGRCSDYRTYLVVSLLAEQPVLQQHLTM